MKIIRKYSITEILAIVWIMVMIIGFVLFMSSCRTRSTWKNTVTRDEIKKITTVETLYTSDEGFSPWSEGNGKTIEISPTINGSLL